MPFGKTQLFLSSLCVETSTKVSCFYHLIYAPVGIPRRAMVSEFFAVAEGAGHTFSLHAKLHMYQAADAEEETDYNYLDAADEVEDDKPSGKMSKADKKAAKAEAKRLKQEARMEAHKHKIQSKEAKAQAKTDKLQAKADKLREKEEAKLAKKEAKKNKKKGVIGAADVDDYDESDDKADAQEAEEEEEEMPANVESLNDPRTRASLRAVICDFLNLDADILMGMQSCSRMLTLSPVVEGALGYVIAALCGLSPLLQQRFKNAIEDDPNLTVKRMRDFVSERKASGAMKSILGLPRGGGASLAGFVRLASVLRGDQEALVALERMSLALPAVDSSGLKILRVEIASMKSEYPEANLALNVIIRNKGEVLPEDDPGMLQLREICSGDEQLVHVVEAILAVGRIKVKIADDLNKDDFNCASTHTHPSPARDCSRAVHAGSDAAP